MFADRNPEKRDEDPDESEDFRLPLPAAWQSPFDCIFEAESLPLPGGLRIELDLPCDWRSLESYPRNSRYIFAPADAQASLVIGCGVMLPEDSLEAIAARTPLMFARRGAEIPVVITIPVIREGEEQSGHMLSFPATCPGKLLGRPGGWVEMFMYTSLVEAGGYWISLETASWGEGCSAAVETRIMSRIHHDARVIQNV